MVFKKNNKKGQAAIEFLMTYGWMLLVVLIVGALIFSFVDFGGLLPNKVDLSNSLRGDPTVSIAYSKDQDATLKNTVKVQFRYTGAKKAEININGSVIKTDLGDICNASKVNNLDTNDEAPRTSGSTTINTINVLNGQDVLMTFDCGAAGVELLPGDSLVGKITVIVQDPKSKIKVPSSGTIRLQIV